MNDGSKSNFLCLSKVDTSKKLQMISVGDAIAIKNDELSIESSITSAQNNVIKINTDTIVNLSQFKYQEVTISFFISGIRYFAKAVADSELSLELISGLYRNEKRLEERLLLFPHHKAYCYIKFFIEEKPVDNVVSLSRGSHLKKEELDDFVCLEKNEMTKGMIGFRVLDISNSGMAIIANEYEVKVLEELKEFNDVVFDLNNYFYEVSTLSFKYTVDYIDSSALDKTMFKVGFKINSLNEKLSNKIERYILSSDSLDESFSEFQSSLKENDED